MVLIIQDLKVLICDILRDLTLRFSLLYWVSFITKH